MELYLHAPIHLHAMVLNEARDIYLHGMTLSLAQGQLYFTVCDTEFEESYYHTHNIFYVKIMDKDM
jgi:hypothetical protein